MAENLRISGNLVVDLPEIVIDIVGGEKRRGLVAEAGISNRGVDASQKLVCVGRIPFQCLREVIMWHILNQVAQKLCWRRTRLWLSVDREYTIFLCA